MLSFAHQAHAPSYYAATALPWEPGAALQGVSIAMSAWWAAGWLGCRRR